MLAKDFINHVREFYDTDKTDDVIMAFIDAVISVNWRDVATVPITEILISTFDSEIPVKKDCIELVKIGTIALIAKSENKATIANNYSQEFNLLLDDIRKRNDKYEKFPVVQEVE